MVFKNTYPMYMSSETCSLLRITIVDYNRVLQASVNSYTINVVHVLKLGTCSCPSADRKACMICIQLMHACVSKPSPVSLCTLSFLVI